MRELKACGHDADHRPALTIKRNGLPDQVRVAAESPLPKIVTEDHDLIAPDLFVVNSEGLPGGGLRTEQREETCRHPRTGDSFRIATALGEIERECVEGGGCSKDLGLP